MISSILLGFILILIIPSYYIRPMIFSFKKNKIPDIEAKIKELEKKIEKLEEIEDTKEFLNYIYFFNLLDKIEEISLWPIDREVIVKFSAMVMAHILMNHIISPTH